MKRYRRKKIRTQVYERKLVRYLKRRRFKRKQRGGFFGFGLLINGAKKLVNKFGG